MFETRRFTIDEFSEIRRLVPGATINDAVLAVCGGALRRYLGRTTSCRDEPGRDHPAVYPQSGPTRRGRGGVR